MLQLKGLVDGGVLTGKWLCRYGDEVENYLDVYLRTPGLERKDVARALLARGNARKMAGEKLLARAQQDFQAVAKLDPTNRELQGYLRRSNMVSLILHLWEDADRQDCYQVMVLKLRMLNCSLVP